MQYPRYEIAMVLLRNAVTCLPARNAGVSRDEKILPKTPEKAAALLGTAMTATW